MVRINTNCACWKWAWCKHHYPLCKRHERPHQEGQPRVRPQACGEAGDAAGARTRVPQQRAAAVCGPQRAQVVHRHAARLVRARQQPPARQHLRGAPGPGIS